MQQQKEQQIAGGYYIKARKIQQSDIAHCSPATREIWDWLLMNANYKESKDGSIKRGQLFRSYEDIREGLKWYIGYRTERYSEDVMKASMKTLRRHLMITTTKTPGGVLITICNYDFYQDSKNYEDPNEITNEDPMKTLRRPQGATIYNKKVKKKKKEDLSLFFKEDSLKEFYLSLNKKIHPKRLCVETNGQLVKLGARLKNFSKAEIIEAADNMLSNPFMMGDNDDNRKYASLEYLLRNDEKVRRLLDKAPGKVTRLMKSLDVDNLED